MSSSMYAVTPIGHVLGGRVEVEDDNWAGVEAVIRLDEAQYTTEALSGLEDFTHLEVVFVFDQVDPANVNTTARRPRGREDWPLVGIFAQRGKARPNRIGVSRCRILGVDGLDVRVAGLDAIDGTPVLDVKPWMAEFGPRGETAQPEWSRELMRQYY